MSALAVLGVIAILQGAFLVLLVVFVAVRRQVDRMRESTFADRRLEIYEPMNAWLAGTGPIDAFVSALRALPGTSALGVTGHLAHTAIPSASRDELAVVLRNERWVRTALAGGHSRRWGRRLEAARCLALAGTPADGELLERLLSDKRPAVAVAAVSALPRVADARLVGNLLDRLATLPNVVRLFLQSTLRDIRTIVEPALIERLASDAPAGTLARWTEMAGALELATALDRVTLLATHPDPELRQAVAHALRRAPRKRTMDVLHLLLRDAETEVRAEAAHSLGELGSTASIPGLVVAVHDAAWNVRFRATLALTQLGEAGRAAVRSLRTDDDRYVADMATLIAGLGDGSLFDMVES